MEELNSLRKEAFVISENLIQCILKRRPIVLKIQSQKVKKDSFQNFDPNREVLLFNSLKDIDSLTLEELLSISLIIESQAGTAVEYPKWSRGIHLTAKPNNISEQINPILLASTFKNSYDALPLNIEYKELLVRLLK